MPDATTESPPSPRERKKLRALIEIQLEDYSWHEWHFRMYCLLSSDLLLLSGSLLSTPSVLIVGLLGHRWDDRLVGKCFRGLFGWPRFIPPPQHGTFNLLGKHDSYHVVLTELSNATQVPQVMWCNCRPSLSQWTFASPLRTKKRKYPDLNSPNLF